MKDSVRVGYYISHPIQYFSPLFRELAERADLTVYYFSDTSVRGGMDKGFGTTVQWDIPLLQGYKSIFLKNRSGRSSMDSRFLDAVNPSIFSTLFRDKSRVVIVNGWTYCSTWMAIIGGKLTGKKVWLRAENPLNQELRKSKRSLILKKLLLRRFLFPLFIDKCLYIGKESKEFFRYYGVKDKDLVFTPYAVDNSYFRTAVSPETSRADLLNKLGLPDKKIILFSGKFIEKKRPLDLLKAFARLGNAGYALVMVGEGELRGQMETFINESGLQNVVLTGFVNQTAIPAYYKVADVFVMCSGMGEAWGLSVNEAMNFDKPVLVSATCGCHADLVKDGINGYVFNEGDIDDLAKKLHQVLEQDALRLEMGKVSGRIIRDYSNEVIVQNLTAELEKL